MLSSQAQLSLIGTVHALPQAAPALMRLLEELCPAHLTLELSRYSLRFRRRQGRRLLQRAWPLLRCGPAAGRPEVSGELTRLLAPPWEYRVCRAFAARQRVPLLLLDADLPARRRLSRLRHELLRPANLAAWMAAAARGDWQESGAEETRRALALLTRAVPAVRQAYLARHRGAEGIGPRDVRLACALRRLLAESSGPLVHVGGWVHLLPDERGETLVAQVADLAPGCWLTTPQGARQLSGGEGR